MKNALAYGALLVAFVGGLAAASAQGSPEVDGGYSDSHGNFCAPAEKLMAASNRIYGEHVQWTGKDADGVRYVVMSGEKTWTLLIIANHQSPNGTFEACVAASDGSLPPGEKGPK
jgi:hypothetical protein